MLETLVRLPLRPAEARPVEALDRELRLPTVVEEVPRREREAVALLLRVPADPAEREREEAERPLLEEAPPALRDLVRRDLLAETPVILLRERDAPVFDRDPERDPAVLERLLPERALPVMERRDVVAVPLRAVRFERPELERVPAERELEFALERERLRPDEADEVLR